MGASRSAGHGAALILSNGEYSHSGIVLNCESVRNKIEGGAGSFETAWGYQVKVAVQASLMLAGDGHALSE
jgi:hypothetical protein